MDTYTNKFIVRIVSMLLFVTITIPFVTSHGLFWSDGDGQRILSEYVKQSDSSRAYEMTRTWGNGKQNKDNWSAFSYGIYSYIDTESNTGNLIIKDWFMRLIETEVAVAETNLPDELGITKTVFDNTLAQLNFYWIKANNKLFNTIRLKEGESVRVEMMNGFNEVENSEHFFSISGNEEILKMGSDNIFYANKKGRTKIEILYFKDNGRVLTRTINVKVRKKGSFF